MSAQTTVRLPLVALVYRASRGCIQYSFGTADELEAWAARHPYRNETLRVAAVTPAGTLAPMAEMPANVAANYVRAMVDKPAAKPTQGQWKVRTGTNGTYVEAGNLAVAFCGLNGLRGTNGWYNITLAEAAANARICAAAPELLEALLEVVRISDRKHDAWDAAHAAIAKATGAWA